jgi:hypothetical protein
LIFTGKSFGSTGRIADADVAERAAVATRRPGQAHCRAEFHQRLVEVAGATRGQQRGIQGPEQIVELAQARRCGAELRRPGCCPPIWADGEEARQNTFYISIQRGRILVEGQAGDGARGVATDAGQGHQRVDGLRKCAAVTCGNRLRGAVQVPGSRVVTQTFPQFQHAVQRRGGKIGDRWQLARQRSKWQSRW